MCLKIILAKIKSVGEIKTKCERFSSFNNIILFGRLFRKIPISTYLNGLRYNVKIYTSNKKSEKTRVAFIKKFSRRIIILRNGIIWDKIYCNNK